MNPNDLKSLIINELDAKKAAELGEVLGRSAFKNLDSRADFALLQSRIAAENEGQKIVALRSRRASFWKIALAAAAVLAGVFFVGKNWSAAAVKMQVVETASNETRKIDLPDGSEVWLNERSRLEFPTLFDAQKRSVSLVGQAFFSVKKDASKPFVVSANDGAQIKVLGTRFDVRAEKGRFTEVFVEEGRVELSAKNQKTQLAAGQFARFEVKNGQIEPFQNAPSQNLTAWQTQKLAFENATFEQVARDFEQFYKIEIAFENPDLKKCRFTSPLPIEEKDPKKAMEKFALTVGATVDFVAPKALIRGGSCQ